jgi:hypothetical protein
MTLLDSGMEVMLHPCALAITALDAAVLAPWSSAGGGGSGTRADYSTGRAAYGFSAKKDLLAQLLALNQQVAAKIDKASPVTAPGVPKNYPDAKKLVTEDCIRPACFI